MNDVVAQAARTRPFHPYRSGTATTVMAIFHRGIHPDRNRFRRVPSGSLSEPPGRLLSLPRCGYRPPNAAAPVFRMLVTKSDPLPLATCWMRATSASSTGMAYSATVCACSR
jgi:hypothetical protein